MNYRQNNSEDKIVKYGVAAVFMLVASYMIALVLGFAFVFYVIYSFLTKQGYI